jgi:UDPglucose--hexose-1-phosphate uridylyltransferase
MSRLRLNPLTGRWVTIAADRASRPADFAPRVLPVEAEPERPCPFCPGNEEATPPALETYGPGGRWSVRVVPNRFPAFSGTDGHRVHQVGPVFAEADANGIHEVLVLSPEHKSGWAELSDKQAGLVMAAVRDRIEDHARLSAVEYTQAIVNHGREAGASIEHPHGQLLGIPFVPHEITEELRGFDRFDQGPCLLCTVIEEEQREQHRIVLDEERVLVVCPYWSASPYEMLLIPKTHEPHLTRASPKSLVAVGHALRDALDRFQRLVGDIAYNVMFHTAPHHHDGTFHWHVHVVPRLTSVAGFEQGTGVRINIVAPEQAARQLADVC